MRKKNYVRNINDDNLSIVTIAIAPDYSNGYYSNTDSPIFPNRLCDIHNTQTVLISPTATKKAKKMKQILQPAGFEPARGNLIVFLFVCLFVGLLVDFVCLFCLLVCFLFVQRQKNISQPAGFEPARGNPIGFRVQRLNHSATTAG